MEQEAPKDSHDTTTIPWGFKTIGVFIVVFWLFTPLLVGWHSKMLGTKDVGGGFGDIFGYINALFSGLAFLGVLIALHFQREDLKVNVRELELTRTEIKATNEALGEQTKQMRIAGLLAAVPVLIDHQKAQLHTLAPDDFRPAADAGYGAEQIDGEIAKIKRLLDFYENLEKPGGTHLYHDEYRKRPARSDCDIILSCLQELRDYIIELEDLHQQLRKQAV